eukprot:scpid1754/ scgid21040/ 
MFLDPACRISCRQCFCIAACVLAGVDRIRMMNGECVRAMLTPVMGWNWDSVGASRCRQKRNSSDTGLKRSRRKPAVEAPRSAISCCAMLEEQQRRSASRVSQRFFLVQVASGHCAYLAICEEECSDLCCHHVLRFAIAGIRLIIISPEGSSPLGS